MRFAARGLFLAVAPLLVFALSKVHAAEVASPGYDFTSSARFAWAVTYVVVMWVSAYALGLPGVVSGWRATGTSAAVAVGLAATAISLIQLLVGDALLPRFVVFGSAILLVPGLTLAALVSQRGHQHAADKDRVFFVGSAAEAVRLADEFNGPLERPAVLVGHAEVAEMAELPGRAPLLEAIQTAKASLIVLDVGAQADQTIVSQTAHAHERGVRVRTLSLFYEEWLGKLPLSELARVSLFFDVGEVHRARYARAKRVADVAVGIAGLPVFAVALPVVAIGNLFGNRGALVFRQERVGKGGTTFTIYKFRTMRPDGDVERWTSEGDPRVTPFGGLLRRAHIDELPQLINILKGDLSMIGPRPEQPRYVAELSEKLPFYSLRHLVRPGLTGWAQVKYGYAADQRDAMEKLQYEFYYLRRQGLALDLRIAARTVRHVVGRGGR